MKSKVAELGLLAGLFASGANMGDMPEITTTGAPIYKGSILPRKVYKARKKKNKQQSRSRMNNR